MRVAIHHETVYRYPAPSTYSIAYLRLTPSNASNQRVVSWKVKAQGNLRAWSDAYGNSAHVLVLEGPHDEVRITAIGEIEIADSGRPLLSDAEPNVPEVFLRATTLTAQTEAVQAVAQTQAGLYAESPRKALDALAGGLRQQDAQAAEDRLHLFLAAARYLGAPARVVSGYLCEADKDSIVPHAWAEAWIEGAGWISFDIVPRPSNATALVRLAVGMDILDTLPVRQQRRDAEFSVDISNPLKPCA